MTRFAVWFVATILLLACTATPARLTKPQFIARWNAICVSDERPLDALSQQVPGPLTDETLPQYAKLFAESARLLRIEIKDLKDVRPPVEDQIVVDRILGHLEAGIAQIGRLRDAASHGHIEAVATAGQNEGLADARELAQRYGVDPGCFGGTGE